MKKFLLLGAAAAMTASAVAQVFAPAPEMDGVDITPAGYKFNTYGKEFIGVDDVHGTPSVAEWQCGNNWYVINCMQKEGFEFGDGYIALVGPLYSGGSYNAENVTKFNEGCKIIDLGGTTGKVLAMNFAGSNFKETYKELTGTDLEIGEIPGGYAIMNMWLDPEVTANYSGISKDGADYMPMRVRFEMNIFANNQGNVSGVWKTFAQNDQGNVVPFGKGDNEAGDILVNPAEFAYRWCEKSDDPEDANDDSVWDEESDNGVWNPNRWMVYEWDFNAPAIESENDNFANIKLKNEIPGAGSGITVLVRNIHVYVPEDVNRDYTFKARPRTWNYYTVGTPAGISTVVADGAEFTFSVNGSNVSFSAPANVYSLSGAKVAEGTNVTLNKGIYVAQSGAKAVKLVVK